MFPKKTASDNVSALIFLPTEVNDFASVFLHGEIETFEETVNIYVTGTCQKFCGLCLGSYSTQDSDESSPSTISNSWIHLRRTDLNYTLSKFRINGINNNGTNIGVVVIFYHPKIFMESETSLSIQKTRKSQISRMDHFGILTAKLKQYQIKEMKVFSKYSKLVNVIRYVILFLSMLSTKALKITQYSRIAIHVNNYLIGLVWITEKENAKEGKLIKKLNYLFAIVFDVILGAISLNILNQHFPLDSFPNFLSGDTIVQMLKDLINWLTGNPAGFKLNYVFSKLLATFFLFYIDIWCAFLAILRPAYKTIMLVFFFIGKAGITFQVSIIEDILTVLTFHIYCICLFAARLYNIQIYALLALWRLFLGRKKNPMRNRVDSCKYTPEQLFVGTLGFTILLFLLPTTLIYYIVFTFFRIILTSCKGTLRYIRYLVQSLQLYSFTLWLMASPKVSTGITLIQEKSFVSRHCLVFYAKPVCSSLRETLAKDKPDFLDETEDFKLNEFLYSLAIGRVHNPHC